MNPPADAPAPAAIRFPARAGRRSAARSGGRRAPASLRAIGVAVLVGCLLPVAYLAVRAIGGSEALDVLFRERSIGIAARTLLLAASTSLGAVALGLPLAWLTVRTDVPLRGLLGSLLALPLAVPSYVAAFAFTTALGPRGLLQQAIEPWTGWERLPEIYGFPGAFLVLVSLNYPYVFFAARARFEAMNPAHEEAARVLGAGRLRRFRRVTLPLLAGPLAAGGMLSALYALSDFGAVSLLRYETLTWAIFNQYRGSLDRNAAAGLALVLVLATLVVLRVVRRYRAAPGSEVSVRRPRTVRLGRLRWPAFGAAAAVLIPSLFLPAGVCLYWLFSAPPAPAGLAVELGRTGLVSAGAALVATALAAPVAFLVIHHPSRFSAAVRGACHVGFGLPGLVVGLSLVFFSVNAATFLYQTLGLLIFAYVVLSLPLALAPVEATLAPLSPRLDDSARTLGARRFRRHRLVTLPLLRPGLTGGFALVFLATVKELPATLMLAPTGFSTLATRIWTSAENVEMGRAAAASLLLLAVSVAVLLLTLGAARRLRPAAERPLRA